jgi:hypothetical protein
MTKAKLFLFLTLALLLSACTVKNHPIVIMNNQKIYDYEMIAVAPIKFEPIEKLEYIDEDPSFVKEEYEEWYVETRHLENYESESCDLIIQAQIKNAIKEYILTHYPNRCEIKSSEIAHHIVEICEKYEDINVDIIVAIMEVESQFNPAAINKRSKAMGLMQVMPFWAKDFNMKSKNELMKIDKNIEAGVKVYQIFLEEQNGNVKKALYRYVGGSRSYSKDVLQIAKRVSTFIKRYTG